MKWKRKMSTFLDGEYMVSLSWKWVRISNNCVCWEMISACWFMKLVPSGMCYLSLLKINWLKFFCCWWWQVVGTNRLAMMLEFVKNGILWKITLEVLLCKTKMLGHNLFHFTRSKTLSFCISLPLNYLRGNQFSSWLREDQFSSSIQEISAWCTFKNQRQRTLDESLHVFLSKLVW